MARCLGWANNLGHRHRKNGAFISPLSCAIQKEFITNSLEMKVSASSIRSLFNEHRSPECKLFSSSLRRPNDGVGQGSTDGGVDCRVVVRLCTTISFSIDHFPFF